MSRGIWTPDNTSITPDMRIYVDLYQCFKNNFLTAVTQIRGTVSSQQFNAVQSVRIIWKSIDSLSSGRCEIGKCSHWGTRDFIYCIGMYSKWLHYLYVKQYWPRSLYNSKVTKTPILCTHNKKIQSCRRAAETVEKQTYHLIFTHSNLRTI